MVNPSDNASSLSLPLFLEVNSSDEDSSNQADSPSVLNDTFDSANQQAFYEGNMDENVNAASAQESDNVAGQATGQWAPIKLEKCSQIKIRNDCFNSQYVKKVFDEWQRIFSEIEKKAISIGFDGLSVHAIISSFLKKYVEELCRVVNANYGLDNPTGKERFEQSDIGEFLFLETLSALTNTSPTNIYCYDSIFKFIPKMRSNKYFLIWNLVGKDPDRAPVNTIPPVIKQMEKVVCDSCFYLLDPGNIIALDDDKADIKGGKKQQGWA